MVINIRFSYIHYYNLLVRSYISIKNLIFLFSLFMFFVNDKPGLIRDIRHREEILAEQELWSDITSTTKIS
jgi:hypothetical protein